MLRLLVLRHAKAAAHGAKHDSERPLTERGRAEAALVGRVMRERSYIPQLVLCSPAARTRETWDEVASRLGAPPDVVFEDSLYDAPEQIILEVVRGADDAARTVLYVGHNPGLERFARAIVRETADAEERRRCEAMRRDFPTAALAVVDFDAAKWEGIAPSRGTLSDFLAPSDLSGS